MPRNKKTAAEAGTALPSIPKELIDQFVTGPMSAEAVQAASMAFKKALIERALGAAPWGRNQSSQWQERQDSADRRRSAASGYPA
jgi:putative transposase